MEVFDTRNLPFVNDSIYIIPFESRSDIFYLFLNTPRFINHPRVLHLDSINDDSLYKSLSLCL